MTDEIIVETSDHAKLRLKLSYNWHFRVNKKDPEDAAKLFAVKDFVGDACKNIASRVRGAVSSITFEDFHHNSAIKISEAVFGREEGNIRSEVVFPANNLVITSVDIQGQEITDELTKKQLA
jgi:major vault protein